MIGLVTTVNLHRKNPDMNVNTLVRNVMYAAILGFVVYYASRFAGKAASNIR